MTRNKRNSLHITTLNVHLKSFLNSLCYEIIIEFDGKDEKQQL